MPKKGKQVQDFSGGVNTYADPQNIADNELAHCSGFKTESGSVIVLGDMKAAYTIGSGDTAAFGNIDLEAGYAGNEMSRVKQGKKSKKKGYK